MFDTVNDVLSIKLEMSKWIQIHLCKNLQNSMDSDIKDILSIIRSQSCAKFQEDCTNSGISHSIVKDSHTVMSLIHWVGIRKAYGLKKVI